MKNIYLLTIAILKGNGLGQLSGDVDNSKKKKFGSLGSVIILSIAALYMGGLGVVYVIGSYDLLVNFGFESAIISIAVSLLAFLVFFFGIFYSISIFYFSSDIDKLLPLPVTAGQLISAKFIVTLLYEYMIAFVLLLPAMITYGILSNSNVIYYVYMIITLLFLPIVPLVIACIIVMAIMRFAPFARNKDAFTLVAGILALAVGFSVGFGMQNVFRGNSEDIANLVTQGAEQITEITSGIFPGTYFANYALANPLELNSLGMILIFIGISIIALLFLYIMGNLLYLKGVVGISSASSKSKSLTEKQMDESIASTGSFVTYIKKEIKILVRTPIFFMNNVLVNFLMPFLLVIPILINSSSGEAGFEEFRQLAKTSIFNPQTNGLTYLLLGFFGIIVFICGTNGITESAISREGKNAYFMKIIPMSYKKQVLAKISTGILLSLAVALLLIISLIIIILPPLHVIVLCLSVIPGAVLFPNVTGIIFDLHMPKLKWDNEQKAVKQNMNVLYGILLSTSLIVLVGFIILFFELTLLPASLIIAFLPLALSGLAMIYINKNASVLMNKILA